MADIKNFLYAWCGKKKLTPNYDIRAAGNKNRQKFMCEVCLCSRAAGFSPDSPPVTSPSAPSGPGGWLQLRGDGELNQQEGCSDQRRQGLCQLFGQSWGDEGRGGPSSGGQLAFLHLIKGDVKTE